MADRIRSHAGDRPVRGRRRGDSQRRVPVGVVRREGLTGRRLGMQQRDRSAERRAWVGPIAALALTVAALGVDSVNQSVLNPVRDAAEVAFAPLQRAMVVSPSDELQQAEAERDRLADELRVEREQDELDAAGAGLFDSDVTAGRELTPARVIGFTAATASSPDRRITIDVGSRDGIEKDLTVVSEKGLVGRVVSVTDWTSEVIVLGDPELSAGVRTSSGAMGMLSSSAPPGTPKRDGNELTLQAFEAGSFKKGDQLTTLGGPNSPFVSGIRVGKIASIDPDKGQLQETAVVQPAVRVSTLEVVGVLTVAERDESRKSTKVPESGSSGDSSGDSSSNPSPSGSGDDSSSSPSGSGGEESAPLDGNPDDDESVLVEPSDGGSVASDAPSDAAQPDSGGSGGSGDAPAPEPTTDQGGQ
ncbi:rod shape-determining protein MreC [Kytococcus sp. Marseille-QA3725]